MAQIYRHNDASTAERMAAHKDFRTQRTMGNILECMLMSRVGWLSIEITYGLYLSDHTILDGIDTELVVLSGIMLQNLKTETGWHLRGTRRVGVSHEDVETIQQCVSLSIHCSCGSISNTDGRSKWLGHSVVSASRKFLEWQTLSMRYENEV